MPLFPKIASPCPYVNRLSEIVDGDVCRMCKRQVFDLTAMSDGERLAFLAGCEEEVCVSYAIPIRPALAAAAMAAAIAIPSAATARPQPSPPPQVPIMVPVAGGIAPPTQVQIVEVPKDATASDIPQMYEDQPVEPLPPATGKEAQPKPPEGQPSAG